jgi:hypothetical protein
VRIHFDNVEPDEETGPLARTRIEARRAELVAMFGFVRERHPEAKSVYGGSWLYNLEAYRRLFPSAYGDSRRPPERARLSGTSSWGQFLDRRGGLKADLAARLIAGLDTLDLQAPWRAFPLPTLATEAPIETFYAFYGV